MRKFWDSSVGKKVVMGVTGLIFVGFVIGHMAGNLQIFMGMERYNAYAKLLQEDIIEVTWAIRVILLVSVILHALSAWQLTQRAWAARPVDYDIREAQVSTYASRTMRWGGVFLAVFILVHLGQFTFGWHWLLPEFSRGAAYGNVVLAFERPLWVVFYLVAMFFLLLHLLHGTWAVLRTLGVAKNAAEPLARRLPWIIALGVTVGFSLVPLGVALGVVR
ncbi:MAG: succinate dehydrogenase cytochrome b subunit [Gemmatimonadaceae bacterium]|nr:succinate dehydrogenase cytochrome b subunit [Gemmatimonadaceae bacterium]